MDQSVEEINEEINKRGSNQPPDRQSINHRSRSRSPESSERGIGMMSPTEDTGMTTMQTGQIVLITIN